MELMKAAKNNYYHNIPILTVQGMYMKFLWKTGYGVRLWSHYDKSDDDHFIVMFRWSHYDDFDVITIVTSHCNCSSEKGSYDYD